MIITLIAGTVNTLLTHPIWMIQTRMCVAKVKKSFFGHIKEIKEEGGWKAFLKGIIPNLFLVINPIINFALYESLRKKVVRGGKPPGFLQILGISFIAKSIATLLTYPMLTVKTLSFTERGDTSFT
jgi:adenine nucleotide transporter 17